VILRRDSFVCSLQRDRWRVSEKRPRASPWIAGRQSVREAQRFRFCSLRGPRRLASIGRLPRMAFGGRAEQTSKPGASVPRQSPPRQPDAATCGGSRYWIIKPHVRVWLLDRPENSSHSSPTRADALIATSAAASCPLDSRLNASSTNSSLRPSSFSTAVFWRGVVMRKYQRSTIAMKPP
jgi:hypothetical protein